MAVSRKRIVWIAGVLFLLLALVLLLRPDPVEVETAPATRGPLRVTVDEEGETRVRDRYVVTAPVAGRVARIELREGDSVPRAGVVALMYPAPLDARSREQAVARVSQVEDVRRSADAAVAQARAALTQSQRGLGRVQELGKRGLIAPEERERAELEMATRERELESADFRAQAAAHDVEQARAALAGGAGRPLALRSPVRGRVLRIPERSERVTAAGASIIEIGDPSRLEVVADLISSDAARIAIGSPMGIEGWGGGALSGRVRSIEPSGFTKVSALGVEEQRVNVIGDLSNPPAALGDRFRVEVHIVVWEDSSVIRVPASAVFRRGEGWAVFQIEEGRARLRGIQVGHRTPFEVEVTAGLEVGAQLVLDPGDRIDDGSRVRIRKP